MASTLNLNPNRAYKGIGNRWSRWAIPHPVFSKSKVWDISQFSFFGFLFNLGPTRCKILPMPLKLDYFFNGTVQTQSSLGNEIEQFKTAVRFLTVMGVTYLIFRLPAAVGNGQEVVKKLSCRCQAVIRLSNASNLHVFYLKIDTAQKVVMLL